MSEQLVDDDDDWWQQQDTAAAAAAGGGSTAAAAAATEVDAADVEVLVAMGFEQQEACKVRGCCKGGEMFQVVKVIST
jgi:hypothetical protein